MLRPRQIAGFLVRFALLYAVSMAPWPGLAEAYGRFYRAAVQIAIASADPERSVVVARAGHSARADAGAALDTHILTRVPGRPLDSQEQVLEWVRSSRYTGYVPLALTLTPILATPLPWRRRAAALCWGGFW